MPQGAPKSGEKYLHFKNKLYQILTLAKHSETEEVLVIYQALYGDFMVYARPLEMFISEVDHQKYPDVVQKYRFLLVEDKEAFRDAAECGASAGIETEHKPGEEGNAKSGKQKNDSAKNEKQKDDSAKNEKQKDDSAKNEEQKEETGEITRLLMDFYDAESYEEKYRILLLMREGITDVMINNMAVVLDVVIPEGELDGRYEELKRCLRTYQRYETARLR